MMAALEERISLIKGNVLGKARLHDLALTLWNFWQKLHRDWVLKFASMLAYQFMISLFPLLLLVLALYGMLAHLLPADDLADVQKTIAGVLPSGIGPAAIAAAFTRLQHISGRLFWIALPLSILAASQLFYSMQDCANIIFRLQARNYLLKQLIAISTTLIYSGIIPILFALAFLPLHWLHLPSWLAGNEWSARGIAFTGSWIITSCLFAVLYKIVPAGLIKWREVWVGAVVASLLLILFEQIFPFFVRAWLRPDNYGAIAGFIIVALAFFYYLAFIILLGMEINSWRVGQRQMASSIPNVLHAVQINNSTQGAAGPTAGTTTEDLRHHEDTSGHPHKRPHHRRKRKRKK